jgi:hypothetical protein
MGGLKEWFVPKTGEGTQWWHKFAGPVWANKVLAKPVTPKIEDPALMPDPEDGAVKAARRRQIAEVQSRSGRASTILSQSDKLGG